MWICHFAKCELLSELWGSRDRQRAPNRSGLSSSGACGPHCGTRATGAFSPHRGARASAACNPDRGPRAAGPGSSSFCPFTD
jgi:hypothetical protein